MGPTFVVRRVVAEVGLSAIVGPYLSCDGYPDLRAVAVTAREFPATSLCRLDPVNRRWLCEFGRDEAPRSPTRPCEAIGVAERSSGRVIGCLTIEWLPIPSR